ncbi:MAG: aminoglycoside phosphotransferase family protein [Bryobacteraceae bacterium]|jgi:aminoglycoside phosphotransferase (APT) family kinase protein
MFLTEANVLHYLLSERFAAIEDVVSGRFTVRGLSRRNHNFRVTSGAREYLVKQVRKWDAESRLSLEREATVYWQARTNPSLAPVSELAPRSHAWDPPNAVLILEYLPEHVELYDLPDRFSPELAQLAGQTMGAFHGAMQSEEHRAWFPAELPSQLSLHETKEEDLAEESAGRRAFVRAVRKYPEYGRALDQLRSHWRPETVIQGDWKLDNCLIPAARDRMRVVDWEFAGWGDPAWDLATLLQSYWNFWVLWPARYRLDEIQPALRATLAGYGQPDIAERAIRFAGARMLQTAFERLDKAERMTPEAVRLMQASLNILTRPAWAAEQLLGTS